ncbi:hypothetical protein VIGAN_03018000, partial [Vigna angularis var. angularis]
PLYGYGVTYSPLIEFLFDTFFSPHSRAFIMFMRKSVFIFLLHNSIFRMLLHSQLFVSLLDLYILTIPPLVLSYLYMKVSYQHSSLHPM